MAMVVEREAKWQVDPTFQLPDLGRLSSVAVIHEPDLQLVASYYDTADGRLLAAGVTLRLRGGEGPERWTLKLPLPPAHHLLARREVDFDGSSEGPPAALRSVLQTLLRGGRLRRICRIETHRTLYRLVDAESGSPLADLCDDRVQAYGAHLRLRRFRVIELELAPAARGVLVREVGHVLQEAGAHGADSRPKLARVVEGDLTREAAPGADRTASAVDCLSGALGLSVRRLVANDPAVRLNLDAEAVHQARVAVRQIRSQLRTFGPLVEPSWQAAIRAELAWLAEALGRVRDVDVMSTWLLAAAAALPSADRSRLGRLEAVAAEQRALALARLQRALASARYRRLVDALCQAAAALPAPPAAAGGAKPEDLAVLLGQPWRRLRRAVKGLPARPRAEELHRVRIRTKHARYALEAAAPAVGRRAARLAAALARLQDDLGEIQDAYWSEGWLRRAALREPSTAVVVGELVAMRRETAVAARARWPGTWRHARRLARPLRAKRRLR
jgi:CHAD domain-containing protein